MSARPTPLRKLLFVGSMFAGSFLLFLVEPLVARMALPRLGGAPAVWNSAMLVYQVLLLAGYAYAHALARKPASMQALVHVALFIAAARWLPLGLVARDLPESVSPALWVPWLLVASIGPLFFVVAAQAPLMQRWFDLSGGSDPYALYAASNLGSLVGLLAYPLLLEPRLHLAEQSLAWSAGYVFLFVCVLACAFTLRAARSTAATDAEAGAAPTLATRARWLLLAAVPSGLMLSTTTHLTTDIVAVPLLWVLPLALYLLSFILAFSSDRTLADAFTRVCPYVLLAGGALAFSSSTDYPLSSAIVGLALFLTVSVSLHAEMYRTRPASAQLTGFYMIMSLGGVIGGLFCALIAPLIFDWTYEHPILVLLAACLCPPLPLPARARARLEAFVTRFTPWLLALAFVGSLVGDQIIWRNGPRAISLVGLALVFVCTLLTSSKKTLYVACLTALMLGAGGWSSLERSVAGVRVRSYFGTYTIIRGPHGERVLNHGTTVHGVQSTLPGHELDATTYYAPKSGVGLALAAAPELFGEHARVGVVGLGAGTLACYQKPGQRFRFYEIDPAIVRVARDPSRFTFMARCAPSPDIVLGDARLSLSREPDARFDVLVVDAFSSDSVPMHLLTREAFALYGRVLSPSGLLLVHISNRYLTLDPVVAASAVQNGFFAKRRTFIVSKAEQALHQSTSRWVVMTRDRALLERLVTAHPGDARGYEALVPERGFQAWTDDYASILPLWLR